MRSMFLSEGLCSCRLVSVVLSVDSDCSNGIFVGCGYSMVVCDLLMCSLYFGVVVSVCCRVGLVCLGLFVSCRLNYSGRVIDLCSD